MDIWAPGARISELLPFSTLIFTLVVKIAEMNVSEPSKNAFQFSFKNNLLKKKLHIVEFSEISKILVEFPGEIQDFS